MEEGAVPPVNTVVYVHGIGNQPVESVLKCRWDTALFGNDIGDRSRVTYWVNRARYPVPAPGDCRLRRDLAVTALAGLAPAGISPGERGAMPASSPQQVIEALTRNPNQRAVLAALAARLQAPADLALTHNLERRAPVKVYGLGDALRRRLVESITATLLPDAHDLLFVPQAREAMRRAFQARLDTGGGPFVVVAHSLGSVIAWDVLRELDPARYPVKLLLTVGSPLGLAPIDDVLRDWAGGELAVPRCVERWVNVADSLDPVAFDPALADDFVASPQGVGVHDAFGPMVNAASPLDPHSSTGYLQAIEVRVPVNDVVGPGFAQRVGTTIITGTLLRTALDADAEQRHPVLIQLASSEWREPVAIDAARKRVIEEIGRLVAKTGDDLALARIDPTRRFVAADLTRDEIETLRSRVAEVGIARLWANATKRALIHESIDTVRARAAQGAHGADGHGIVWAVLDTGINGEHPHFRQHGNIVRQFDCTELGKVSPHRGSARLDRSGHGTHVAAIISGEYPAELDLLDADGRRARFAGMAPRAALWGYKVLRDDGSGQDSFIIKALDHIAETNDNAGRLVVHGVNLSLGGPFDPSVYGCGHTPLCQELRRLWQQGVVVVIAAGNEGFAMLESTTGSIAANLDLSIGDPANLDEAIAVGSVHKTRPHIYGISWFSSRGPTADGRRKPDVVAPGEQVLSAWHACTTAKPTRADQAYVEMSGTSMAAPHVSGILAGFLSRNREYIGYPERTKARLLEACTTLHRDPFVQGHGCVSAARMFDAA